MNLKKMLLLAGMALAAVAFAAPAAAQASATWTTNHEPISVDTYFHAHGEVEFGTAFGGYKCPATATGTLFAGTDEGEVETFNIVETAGCSGNGFLEGCKLEEHEVFGLPYTLTATKEDIDANGNISVYNGYDAACAFGESEVHFEHITLTPDTAAGSTAATATYVNVEGEGIATVAGQELEAFAGGTLHLTDESGSGVLGVHEE